jgi:hypothetical protein
VPSLALQACADGPIDSTPVVGPLPRMTSSFRRSGSLSRHSGRTDCQNPLSFCPRPCLSALSVVQGIARVVLVSMTPHQACPIRGGLHVDAELIPNHGTRGRARKLWRNRESSLRTPCLARVLSRFYPWVDREEFEWALLPQTVALRQTDSSPEENERDFSSFPSLTPVPRSEFMRPRSLTPYPG